MNIAHSFVLERGQHRVQRVCVHLHHGTRRTRVLFHLSSAQTAAHRANYALHMVTQAIRRRPGNRLGGGGEARLGVGDMQRADAAVVQ